MLKVTNKDNYEIVGDGKDKNPINKIYKDEWIAFLEVRQDGQYNMYSPEARNSVDMDRDTWAQIMDNFDDLYEKWGDLNECV
tara:strand:+ start:511 stop:756 length:246 start_codon:yes stop_codon:yes gene_type:complete